MPTPQIQHVRESMTFRVFVSSTFRDFVAERNALQNEVWPRLRELCQRHGAAFQAIDLRWGVSEEASREQQIMQICLEEIRRCQQVTPRPNFIVLLGDRYGWRPAPEIVPQVEFDAIIEYLSSSDRQILREWYTLDENAIPPEYCLLPRRKVSYDDWLAIERRLHALLLDGATAAGLSDSAMIKFERSATEQEIIDGALHANPRNAFAYFRKVDGLPEDHRADDFIDITDGQRDVGCEKLLNDLKAKLCEHLSAEHHHSLETRWNGHELSEQHIGELCDLVYEDLKRAIVEQIDEREAVDPLDHEIERHREFAQDRARHFVGRQEVIRRIADYVQNGGRHPLVIHGSSGSGKSALLAHLLGKLSDDAVIIFRFIGATPASTDVRSLLESLCHQINRIYSIEDKPVPHLYRDLVPYFAERLAVASAGTPMTLILDGLDQLGPEHGAHSLNWLPETLPPGARVILSVLQREDAAGDCFESAQRLFPEHALLQLPALSTSEGAAILDAWLNEAGRNLQHDQRADVLGKFRICPEGHALFLRLAFEESRRWRSFDGLPSGHDTIPGLSSTIGGVIKDMLARLEAPANHGNTMVEFALGYLAAARYGLSEDEMLGLLSRDLTGGDIGRDRFRECFWNRHPYSPRQIDALPVVVWSRLFFDLRPYLAERVAKGASLLGFCHRVVEEAVAAQYLRLDHHVVHARLADYFHEAVDAVRYPASPDAHALAELPYALGHAGQDQRLADLLSDLAYLDDRIRVGDVYPLVQDYQLQAEDRRPATRPIEGFLREHAQRLSRYRAAFFALAHHEGVPVLQSQAHALAAAGAWPKPWLRAQPGSEPPRTETASSTQQINVVAECEFEHSVAVALAPERLLAARVRSLGQISLIDLGEGQEWPVPLQVRPLQPLVIACSPDGQCLAVAFVDGEIDVLRLTYDQQGQPPRQTATTVVPYMLPDYEDPALLFAGHTLWYQAPDGSIAGVRVDGNADLTPLLLPDDLPGAELSALAVTDDIVVAALRCDGDVAVMGFADDRQIGRIQRSGADVSTMCACGSGRVAVAFTDRTVALLECADGVQTIETTTATEQPTCLVSADDSLIWAAPSAKLYAWTPAQQHTPHELVASGATHTGHSRRFQNCTHLANAADAGLLSVGSLCATRFTIGAGGARHAEQLLAVHAVGPPGECHAFEKRPDGLCFVNGRSGDVIWIAREYQVAHAFAADGLGLLLAARSIGQGAIVLPDAATAAPVTDIPEGTTSVAGDAAGGFWLTTVTGDIWFVDRARHCRPVLRARAPDVGSSDIHCWAGLLLWQGAYYAETRHGASLVPVLTFLVPQPRAPQPIRLIGTRQFAVADGALRAVAYDVDRGRVLTVWQNGVHFDHSIKFGTVEQFIDRQEQEVSLAGVDQDVVAATVAPDGSGLYLLSERGNLFRLDSDSFALQAVWSGAQPLTAIGNPAFADDGSLLLVAANDRPIWCNFQEARP